MDQWSDRTLKACFYVAIAAVSLAGLWLNAEPYICPIPTAVLSGEKPAQPPCFEFWFNRYQTLIGSLVAIGAAGLAWKATSKTIAFGREQVAISNLDRLEARLLAFQDLGSKAVAVHHDAVQQVIEHMEVRALLAELRWMPFFVGGRASADAMQKRERVKELVKASDRFQEAVMQFEAACKNVQLPIAVSQQAYEAFVAISHFRRQVRSMNDAVAGIMDHNYIPTDVQGMIERFFKSHPEAAKLSPEAFMLLDVSIVKQARLVRAMREKVAALADGYVSASEIGGI
ncbi:hypothetical protein [Methylorubrum thiocyanatum]|uniref:Nucleic acid-binding OB-fold protein n=1 Tax=Methylorubrum thiocyanatum TaxID=47958 RepID=A0AA40S0S6_9HYPH|nr:hypothetical protein [Methylorubrum thiocyanatum]MBA8912052.1 putative nucleic acid-binding OB-fold protein [Methylorubrum thiocyanatum]